MRLIDRLIVFAFGSCVWAMSYFSYAVVGELNVPAVFWAFIGVIIIGRAFDLKRDGKEDEKHIKE